MVDEKVLLVDVRNVYGKEKIYPVGPKGLVYAVAGLTGKITIDQADIVFLNTLGIKVEEDRPVFGKLYALTGGSGSKCIMNGNTWKESEVAK
jgi:hypothetical protein